MTARLLRKNRFWLVLSLALCLISAIGASAIQTGGGSITVKDLTWETSSGRALNALLFVPDSATAETPAPAVVLSHGWWNNREMQDANYVELARRGFVVMSIDMYGHGNSDPLPASELPVGGTGLYDAIKLVADLPYVDPTRIGTSGHSNGARAANFSVVLDNEAAVPLIAAVFLVDNEAMYTDPADETAGQYVNMYQGRDVGLVADQYDEFFFRSYDADGTKLTPPREFASTPNAQSFLNFGADPATSEPRAVDTLYTENVDGEQAIRVLHTPAETHPWGTISPETVANQVAFFEQSLGAPNAIAPTQQIWQWKELFTTLGLIGFGIFLVAMTRALLGTRAFARATLSTPAPAQPLETSARWWFWGGLLASAIFSAWSYVWLSQQSWLAGITHNAVPNPIPTGSVFFIGVWAAVNGVFTVIVLAVVHLTFGRKAGARPGNQGLLIGWRPLMSTIGLAVTATASAFLLVFFIDYFWKTDFRLWVVAVKWFPQDKIGYALVVLPLFLLYFVANSVAINVFNRSTLLRKEWLNTAVLAGFNALGPAVLVIAQYWTFGATGDLIAGFGGIYSIWLFPVVLILAVTAVISRKLYRETNNPYLAGFLNAAVVALISVSNSLVMTY